MDNSKVASLLNEYSHVVTSDVYAGIGDGWYPLLLVALKYLDRNRHSSMRLACVKEKYSAMRIKVTCEDEKDQLKVVAANELLRTLEDASNLMCEECGRPGDKHATDGWLKTLCREHQIHE